MSLPSYINLPGGAGIPGYNLPSTTVKKGGASINITDPDAFDPRGVHQIPNTQVRNDPDSFDPRGAAQIPGVPGITEPISTGPKKGGWDNVVSIADSLFGGTTKSKGGGLVGGVTEVGRPPNAPVSGSDVVDVDPNVGKITGAANAAENIFAAIMGGAAADVTATPAPAGWGGTPAPQAQAMGGLDPLMIGGLVLVAGLGLYLAVK